MASKTETLCVLCNDIQIYSSFWKMKLEKNLCQHQIHPILVIFHLIIAFSQSNFNDVRKTGSSQSKLLPNETFNFYVTVIFQYLTIYIHAFCFNRW